MEDCNQGFLSTIHQYDSCIGQGSFGIVLKAVNTSGDLSAVKFIFPNNANDEVERKKFLREFLIPGKLQPHNCVVAIKSAEEKKFTAKDLKAIFHVLDKNQTDSTLKQTVINRAHRFQTVDVICIQSELCGENLRQWLQQYKNQGITDSTAAEASLVQLRQVVISHNLITGLKYLHDNKIMHRDLKPENIMFSNAGYILPVKIGDFGMCRKYHSETSQTNVLTTGVGTISYMAPEIRSGKDYTHQADLYSLGLIIWEVIQFVDRVLFERLVYDEEESLVKPHDVMPGVEEIIINLTKRKPEERIKNLDNAATDVLNVTVVQNKKMIVQTSEELRLCLRFVLKNCEIVLLEGVYEGPFILRGESVTLSGNNSKIVTKSEDAGCFGMHGTSCTVSNLQFVGGQNSVALYVTGDNNIVKHLKISTSRDGILIKGKNNCVHQIKMTDILHHGMDVYGRNNTLSNITGINMSGLGIVLHGQNNSLTNISFLRTTHISGNVKDFIGVLLRDFASGNVVSRLTVLGCRKESNDFGLVVDAWNCSIKDSKCGPIRILGKDTTLTNVDCGELLIVGKIAGVKISKCRGNNLQVSSPIMIEDCNFGPEV